jgi:hypothetical protein
MLVRSIKSIKELMGSYLTPIFVDVAGKSSNKSCNRISLKDQPPKSMCKPQLTAAGSTFTPSRVDDGS